MKKNQYKELLKQARQFDVHTWKDCPEIRDAVSGVFDDLVAIRKRNSKRLYMVENVRKHLKVLLQDLYLAWMTSPNPFVGISQKAQDYSPGTRYAAIHVSYRRLKGVLEDLIQLGYVKKARGWKDFATGKGRRTRIRGTRRLIERLHAQQTGLASLSRRDGIIRLYEPASSSLQLIVLKDSRKKAIPYEDTSQTLDMKANLARINAKLAASRITLKLTEKQWPQLFERLKAEDSRDHVPVNFTHTQLFRVFNVGRFDQGGRFYGGWWQSIPRDYRPYIDINHKPTVELDYSGHHARILYARAGLALPQDPYDLEDFDREDQKQAFNTILNANSRASAVKSLNSEGIANAKTLCRCLEQRHAAIVQSFYTGVGRELQYLDSLVAEEVMLHMLKLGATVLPLHDSFIVRNSYEKELRAVMFDVFQAQFAKEAGIKAKKTYVELEPKEAGTWKAALLNLDDIVANYETYFQIFGT